MSAAVGPLRLPRRLARTFDDSAGFRAYLRGRGARRLPSVDFDRRRVVLVAAGARSSAAYRVHVVGVVEERRRIRVSVRMRSPTLSKPGRARLSFPYRMITVPARGKPIRVEWLGL